MLAPNTSSSESTGYSPAFITQGRNPRLPKAVYDEVTIGSGVQCVSPEERANELKNIFKIVRNNLEKVSQKQRHHYNLRHQNWSPKIGDYALVLQHPLFKAVDHFASKLATKFKGPYVVFDFVSPVIVQARVAENGEKITALKAYQSNNYSFSFISSRHCKPSEQKVVVMEANQRKFEWTREKFRRNIQAENGNIRRSIFSEGDAPPKIDRSAGTEHHALRLKPHQTKNGPQGSVE